MKMNFNSDEKKKLAHKFRFGLESEYMLADKNDFTPLWHKNLSFEKLNAIFEKISLEGLPSCEGLELEKPQTKLMPFVVEGYHLPDMDFQAKELLPKGVEIRTPVCSSIEEALSVHKILYTRLKKAMNENQYELVSLSHHPIESKFLGPQNKRRYDYWQWSMEVMTTYGPDINVGIPDELVPYICTTDLQEKINYYGPALSALTVASPFCNGEPWQYAKGKFGKSYRMHKRSYIAPPIEIHFDENNRFEFKVFDMPNSAREIEAQILSFLLLIFNEKLTGRANHQTRIYDLGEVAKKGLEADGVIEKAEELMADAQAVLDTWGFNSDALDIFRERLKNRFTPADEMLQIYNKNKSITDVLRFRSEMRL